MRHGRRSARVKAMTQVVELLQRHPGMFHYFQGRKEKRELMARALHIIADLMVESAPGLQASGLNVDNALISKAAAAAEQGAMPPPDERLSPPDLALVRGLRQEMAAFGLELNQSTEETPPDAD
jgi:hypothetical protein